GCRRRRAVPARRATELSSIPVLIQSGSHRLLLLTPGGSRAHTAVVWCSRFYTGTPRAPGSWHTTTLRSTGATTADARDNDSACRRYRRNRTAENWGHQARGSPPAGSGGCCVSRRGRCDTV